MKTTNRILLILLGALGALLLISIITLRVFTGISSVEIDGADTSAINKSYDFKDYDGIVVSGAWEIEIKQGNNYALDMEIPGAYKDNVTAETRDGILYIKVASIKQNLGTGRFQLQIQVPELNTLQFTGASETVLRGFRTEKLDVQLTGANELSAIDCTIENLTILTDGASDADFYESVVTNADINGSGASHIKINMDGGDLTGTISGVCSVRYKGTVRRQAVIISGLGKIHNANR